MQKCTLKEPVCETGKNLHQHMKDTEQTIASAFENEQQYTALRQSGDLSLQDTWTKAMQAFRQHVIDGCTDK
jgi:hypothetical protein